MFDLRSPLSGVRRSLCVFAIAASSMLCAPSLARANRGLLYGPEDVVAFGEPDANGLVGYCVPWSLLAATHVGFGATMIDSRTSLHRVYLDLTQGIRCGKSLNADPGVPGYVFIPQVGYTLESYDPGGTGPAGATHLARVGLGFGVGTSRAAITYAPRLVIGNREGVSATGVRHGLIASFGSDLVTFEASHQMLVVGGHVEHDLRIGMSLNWLILAYIGAH